MVAYSIAILGSTGSIGTQTISVIARYPDLFRLVGILARGHRLDILYEQIELLHPQVIAVTDPQGQVPDGWITGSDATERFIDTVASSCDVIMNAIEGIAGVLPSIQVLHTGTRLALANKETLVCAGKYVMNYAAPDQIWPVDSEHSALAQALRAGMRKEVDEFVITASGGPFRGKQLSELYHVTPEQALAHPTWSMGDLITINSATLANKALEVIEAHELFALPYDQIRVTVHPQSIVHSMVTYKDGSTIAQASPPSMLIPIAYAITSGQRLDYVAPKLDFSHSYLWTFDPVDEKNFPALRLARQVGAAGGLYPAIFTAATETAARAFLQSRISFPIIMQLVEQVLNKVSDYFSLSSGGTEENGPKSSLHSPAATIPSLAEISAAMVWSSSETSTMIP